MSSSGSFPRNFAEFKPFDTNNKINKSDGKNLQITSVLSQSALFRNNTNFPKGRKLLEDFEKINIIHQNESTTNKNNYQESLNDNKNQNNNWDELNNIGKVDNSNETEQNQKTKKFFTELGAGYKCSCAKTHCNRFYCECYREKRYCLNCNCIGCQNKPPKNSCSNKHPDNEADYQENGIISCTCTKSGCNKKYCECYKNGTKCNSS